MIREANQLGPATSSDMILEAKDKEIQELKEQLEKIKAEQDEMLERNKKQIEAIKQQKAAAVKGQEEEVDAYVM